MIAPVSGRISRGFSAFHTALDIVNAYRTAIRAPETGKVTYTGQMGSGLLNAGNVVQIGNPATNGHRLCHLDSIIVKNGQSVVQGQVVGYMGYTGFTIPRGIGGTHLHWIVFRGGKRVNPSSLVSVPSGSPSVPAKMPPVGSRIKVTIPRTVFVAGTTTVKGTLPPDIRIVRGYDPRYSNRILVDSASLGKGIALALYLTNGSRIAGWTQL